MKFSFIKPIVFFISSIYSANTEDVGNNRLPLVYTNEISCTEGYFEFCEFRKMGFLAVAPNFNSDKVGILLKKINSCPDNDSDGELSKFENCKIGELDFIVKNYKNCDIPSTSINICKDCLKAKSLYEKIYEIRNKSTLKEIIELEKLPVLVSLNGDEMIKNSFYCYIPLLEHGVICVRDADSDEEYFVGFRGRIMTAFSFTIITANSISLLAPLKVRRIVDFKSAKTDVSVKVLSKAEYSKIACYKRMDDKNQMLLRNLWNHAIRINKLKESSLLPNASENERDCKFGKNGVLFSEISNEQHDSLTIKGNDLSAESSNQKNELKDTAKITDDHTHNIPYQDPSQKYPLYYFLIPIAILIALGGVYGVLRYHAPIKATYFKRTNASTV